MHKPLTASIAVALSLITGCQNPSRVAETLLRIETNKLVYSRGDSLDIAVTNVGAATVSYVPCPIVVERALGASWEALGPLPGYAADDCDATLLELKPSQARIIRARLDQGLSAGSYRLRLPRMRAIPDAPLSDQSTVTNTFTVN